MQTRIETPTPAPPAKRGGADRHAVKGLRLAVAALIGLALWFVPIPEGVEPRGMHLLAIFVATILAIVAKALPMGALAVISLAAAVLTETLSIEEALSAFAATTVWLIVAAFFLAGAFIKTGLGMRIAYHFMQRFGKRSIGLAYSLMATDFVLAPAIPSHAARAGGVVHPILRSINETYDSRPHDGTARRIGSYLSITVFQATCVTSGMFVTAMAANPLAVKLAGDLGIHITWGSWALAALVPGLLALLLMPLMIHAVYPPEIRETPAAPRIAQAALAEMGPVKRNEWTLLTVFVSLILLWILGPRLGVHSTSAALAGIAVLLITGVITWGEVSRDHEAWSTLIWFATLVMMATFLGTLGVTTWFSKAVAGGLSGVHWVPAFLILSLTYFYSHYFFASNTAHLSAMYAPFLAAALLVGTPPMLAALLLAYFSNMYACLTHYGSGAAPIFFGADYVPLGTWWRIGLLCSVLYIAIFLTAGSLWWKVLGIW
jgi:DASS family divalent anion:Na+ symporter